MPWKKGQSGNPSGQHRDKAARDALRMTLAELDGGETGKTLREIWRVVIEKAKAGELPAIIAMCDRLDGKPTQMLEHTGEESRRITKIVHEIVDVTVTQDQIDRETDGQNLLVDYSEAEAINGHGSNGHGGNGHGGEGDKPVPSERVGRHRP